jgi:hypothetical protein
MALVKTILETELSKFTNASFSGFVGFPTSPLDVGVKWSEAIDTFAGLNTLPLSTTYTTAKQALKTSFAAITSPNLAQAQVIAGFAAYATALALGMTGFVSVPPPAPINLAPVSALGFGGASSATCNALAADIITDWFKTGTATPLPSGAVINWS